MRRSTPAKLRAEFSSPQARKFIKTFANRGLGQGDRISNLGRPMVLQVYERRAWGNKHLARASRSTSDPPFAGRQLSGSGKVSMGLKPCRECGKDISTEARSCPHCGAPEPAGPRLHEGFCVGCGEQILAPMTGECPRCGVIEPFTPTPTRTQPEPPSKSNVSAGCLGLLLGPVGLWYKGQWAAGFGWLVMTLLLSLVTYGIAAPFCWIGMAIHAAVADSK